MTDELTKQAKKFLDENEVYLTEEWKYCDTTHINNDSDKFRPKEKCAYVYRAYWGAICFPPPKESPQYSRHPHLMRIIAQVPDMLRYIQHLTEALQRKNKYIEHLGDAYNHCAKKEIGKICSNCNCKEGGE